MVPPELVFVGCHDPVNELIHHKETAGWIYDDIVSTFHANTRSSVASDQVVSG